MTIRPSSARVSSRKNGRKSSLSQGAVLSVSQANPFNLRRLFSVTPSVVRVGENIYSYDNDTLEISKSTVSAGTNLEELPVEVVQIYDRNGNLSSIPVYFTHDGTTYLYESNSFTNNYEYGVKFTSNVFNQFSGKYLTHNHPPAASFSLDDFVFARRAKLLGIEAIAHRKNFWRNVNEITARRSQLLNELDGLRRSYYQQGLTDGAMVVERMMQFAMQIKSNPSEPSVRFQATPQINRGWSSKIVDNNWYKAVYLKLMTDTTKLRSVSLNASNLLASHALNEMFAEKAGFRYSVLGIE